MAASGLQAKQQNKWVADITDMMAEGPRVILILPKIRKAIVASPEPMLWFSKKRMELEMLQLEGLSIGARGSDENGAEAKSDAIRQAIRRRMDEILMEVGLWMIEEGCAVNDLLDIRDIMLM